MSPSSEGKNGLSKRSCTRCNQKKVRCDRKTPCGRCLRTGDECIHPGNKRAPRKLKRPPISEILDHLHQLEAEVERLQSAPAKQSPGASPDSRTEANSQNNANKPDTPGGRLIQELQEVCDKSSSGESATYTSISSNGSLPVPEERIFAPYHSASAKKHHIQYPQPFQIWTLWDVYMKNVAPLISLLHIPSVERMIGQRRANPDPDPDLAQEALTLAICFAAVVSMTPQQCLSILNEDHDVCIRNYKISVEQTLAKANLISTQNILVLQAAVLFLLCLRRCGYYRTIWAEASIVVRVAQGQGVHRDAERLGLSPFEIEMRRQLWWHICILDMLCSEDQGTDTQIRPEMFDTKIPSNIEGSALNPQLAVLPLPRYPFVHRPDTRQPSTLERGKILSGLADRLETLYLRHFDLDIPIQWITAVIARLTLSKAWLVNSLNASTTSDTTKDDEIFHMGVEILQFATLLQNNETTKQWAWLSKSYKQRHVAAFILSEICVRPITAETEHAWEVVTKLYSEWVQEETRTNVMLQKPLSRLMERAALSRREKLAKDDAQPIKPAAEKTQEPIIPRSADLPPANFRGANVTLSDDSMLETDVMSRDLHDFIPSSLDWLTGPLL
ncbi:hypothetical protein UA08_04249 [Talaromyces atroroseus]|uniref:Zn(2)-C6 fungal-type domain-containing protein n=1 Tax=Talaromyces atroroseus TaxID=1441469 RepID=A0A1Q5Q9N9_TALAT|nr:hypothetical protein UA08_04249 [Talaromyces atroroseus]OKL60739.1 hypothetical protein UA08_04249 [Talaromyces atroroseus]